MSMEIKETTYEQELDEAIKLISGEANEDDMPLPPDAATVVLMEFSARMLAKIVDRLDVLMKQKEDKSVCNKISLND